MGDFSLRRFAGPDSFVESLGNIRVAHLTDMHVGRVTPMAIQQQAIELTNSTHPDLVTITGDFVCHSQLFLDELSELVASIDAPVLCTLGNHDHWAGSDEVRWALRRGGAEVLDNQHTVLQVGSERLQVVGLDDAYTGHADVRRATKGLRSDLPTLGLSHIGEEADRLWSQGVRLVLSGHTHAGQITVAKLHELWLGNVVGHRYIHGLYGDRRCAQRGAVYVGAGIGASVMPFRVGRRGRREVAVFELGKAPGTFTEDHAEQAPREGRKPSPTQVARRAAAVVRKRERRERRRRARALR